MASLHSSEAQHSPKAKKSLGQHFLRHPEIAERIVRLLHIQPGDSVIEIGPGPGALTHFLRQSSASQLFLLEKDSHWARVHSREGAGLPAQVVLTDALTMDWSRLDNRRNWKIVGNLPYNVASPLMWDIFSQTLYLQCAAFMIQKEVGSRIIAPTGCKEYGALSVWLQSYTSPRKEFVVGPGAFAPPPKVDSMVLSFVPRCRTDLPPNPEGLRKTLAMCFQMRRKQLYTILRMHHFINMERDLEKLGIDPQARPETLSPQRFHALSQLLYGLTSSAKHG